MGFTGLLSLCFTKVKNLQSLLSDPARILPAQAGSAYRCVKASTRISNGYQGSKQYKSPLVAWRGSACL